MKPKIALIFGGKSVEHEVSVITGIQALMSMDTDKYEVIPVYFTKKNEMYIGEDIGNIEAYKDIPGLLSRSQRVIMISDRGNVKLINYPLKKFGKNTETAVDIAFPAVHGTNVEDGALQGYLKTLGIPFVGCDVTASAIGMDKYIMKTVLRDKGISVLECKVFTLSDYEDIEGLLSQVEEAFAYPVIIKPVNLGSSVGISIASNREELISSVDDSFKYSTRILVEKAISNLREINCAVLGDENEAVASECEEPIHVEGILSYEDKYAGGNKGVKSQEAGAKSAGMAGAGRKIPAELSEGLRKEIRSMAVKAFKALGCSGVARIDFMIDNDTGKLYFNEINTIPGSLSFYLWEPINIPYKELLNRLIDLALKRARKEAAITFSFDVNILDSVSLSGGKTGKCCK